MDALTVMIERVRQAYHSLEEQDFGYSEAASWSLVYSARWVFGGMVGGLMAAVVLADLPSQTTWMWALFFLLFAFFFEFILRLSTREEDL